MTYNPPNYACMDSGKEKFLPLGILNLPALTNFYLPQLFWLDMAVRTNIVPRPDVIWEPSKSIRGVTFPYSVEQRKSCLTWVNDYAVDLDYIMTWTNSPPTLTLPGGPSVAVTTCGTYQLFSGYGAIDVNVDTTQLPGTNSVGTVGIAPARGLAPVP